MNNESKNDLLDYLNNRLDLARMELIQNKKDFNHIQDEIIELQGFIAGVKDEINK